MFMCERLEYNEGVRGDCDYCDDCELDDVACFDYEDDDEPLFDEICILDDDILDNCEI